jgi:hypothetical protein
MERLGGEPAEALGSEQSDLELAAACLCRERRLSAGDRVVFGREVPSGTELSNWNPEVAQPISARTSEHQFRPARNALQKRHRARR